MSASRCWLSSVRDDGPHLFFRVSTQQGTVIGEVGMLRALACPFFRKAFGWCVPIGGLAGLIGLGGGEFRLPVLMHGIGFDAKSAVPLNLMISLVTLTFAMFSRSRAVSFRAISPHLSEV